MPVWGLYSKVISGLLSLITCGVTELSLKVLIKALANAPLIKNFPPKNPKAPNKRFLGETKFFIFALSLFRFACAHVGE